MTKSDWNKSIFTELVRMTKEDKDWLKENKGNKSMAGFLKDVIDFYITEK